MFSRRKKTGQNQLDDIVSTLIQKTIINNAGEETVILELTGEETDLIPERVLETYPELTYDEANYVAGKYNDAIKMAKEKNAARELAGKGYIPSPLFETEHQRGEPGDESR